ncbi:MAG TPA: DUF86 domain-containing protein [Gemmataceae bacterium]|jgi:uncharacterized protein with HEPN domain|nr:DUF86 domain-containing protein [Gemmataceae bacterium]
MRPETKKYLLDVFQACMLLEQFVAGKTFVDYDSDPLLRSAVERQFITIGEALAQAEKVESGIRSSLSAFRQIVGFRNILVHAYAVVHNATVWGVVENELPTLRRQVDALLNSPSSP